MYLQVMELITMEKVRIASNWPAVIKYTLRIVSILHYAQRGRIISLVETITNAPNIGSRRELICCGYNIRCSAVFRSWGQKMRDFNMWYFVYGHDCQSR